MVAVVMVANTTPLAPLQVAKAVALVLLVAASGNPGSGNPGGQPPPNGPPIAVTAVAAAVAQVAESPSTLPVGNAQPLETRQPLTTRSIKPPPPYNPKDPWRTYLPQ
jgi:hypothetical protein